MKGQRVERGFDQRDGAADEDVAGQGVANSEGYTEMHDSKSECLGHGIVLSPCVDSQESRCGVAQGEIVCFDTADCFERSAVANCSPVVTDVHRQLWSP